MLTFHTLIEGMSRKFRQTGPFAFIYLGTPVHIKVGGNHELPPAPLRKKNSKRGYPTGPMQMDTSMFYNPDEGCGITSLKTLLAQLGVMLKNPPYSVPMFGTVKD